VSPAYDWRLLAELNKPTDHLDMAEQIRKLRESGLMPYDISEALRIDIAAVHQALQRAGA